MLVLNWTTEMPSELSIKCLQLAAEYYTITKDDAEFADNGETYLEKLAYMFVYNSHEKDQNKNTQTFQHFYDMLSMWVSNHKSGNILRREDIRKRYEYK